MPSHWKRVELNVAKRMGGVRVPITGRQRGDVPDIRHDHVSIECKSRNALPTWLLTALAQAQAAALPGQLPLARLHENGSRYDNDVICVRARDWEEFYGSLPSEVAE